MGTMTLADFFKLCDVTKSPKLWDTGGNSSAWNNRRKVHGMVESEMGLEGISRRRLCVGRGGSKVKGLEGEILTLNGLGPVCRCNLGKKEFVLAKNVLVCSCTVSVGDSLLWQYLRSQDMENILFPYAFLVMNSRTWKPCNLWKKPDYILKD